MGTLKADIAVLTIEWQRIKAKRKQKRFQERVLEKTVTGSKKLE